MLLIQHSTKLTRLN